MAGVITKFTSSRETSYKGCILSGTPLLCNGVYLLPSGGRCPALEWSEGGKLVWRVRGWGGGLWRSEVFLASSIIHWPCQLVWCLDLFSAWQLFCVRLLQMAEREEKRGRLLSIWWYGQQSLGRLLVSLVGRLATGWLWWVDWYPHSSF